MNSIAEETGIFKSNALRIICGIITTVAAAVITLGAFVISITAMSMSEQFISGITGITALIFTGAGVLLIINNLSLRTFSAWSAVVAGFFLFALTLIYYSQRAYLVQELWFFLMPFPSFTLIIWGSFYLIKGPELIEKLKIKSIYIWLYAGFAGGALADWFITPWREIPFFYRNEIMKYILLAGIIIFMTAVPLVWFLTVKKKTQR